MEKLTKKEIWKKQLEANPSGKEYVKTNEEWKELMIVKAKRKGTYLSAQTKRFNKKLKNKKTKPKKKTYFKKPKPKVLGTLDLLKVKIDEVNYWKDFIKDLNNTKK